jgi:hypothetical protein
MFRVHLWVRRNCNHKPLSLFLPLSLSFFYYLGLPLSLSLLPPLSIYIRALSAHSADEFNSSPGRCQPVWLVAIVPPERWGKMDRNDCHTAWGNFKTLISSLHHSKNYACSFSLIDFLFYFYVFFYLSDLVLPSTGWQYIYLSHSLSLPKGAFQILACGIINRGVM